MNELENMLAERQQLNEKIHQYLKTTFKDWLLSNIATLKLDFVCNGWSGEHLSITFLHDFNLSLLNERIMFEKGLSCHIESKNSQRLTLTFPLSQPFVKNWLPVFLANPKINEIFNLVAF